jgi:hypothetical protein
MGEVQQLKEAEETRKQGVALGLGRIVALYYRSPALHQIR